MSSKFSDRIGLTKPRTALQKDDISEQLRSSLWSVFFAFVIKGKSNESKYDRRTNRWNNSDLADFFELMYLHFFKKPVDEVDIRSRKLHDNAIKGVREWFLFTAPWYEVFNFLEWCANLVDEDFTNHCNEFLKTELSAYRFVDKRLVEISSEEEIGEIEKALAISDVYKPVREHFQTALNLLADKNNPDYRNSIKESISAVESLSMIILNEKSITLGQALKQIEAKHKLPASLKAGFSALYGFTSDEGGIRHALLDDTYKVSIDEARFMLIVCSAFVNYLITKST